MQKRIRIARGRSARIKITLRTKTGEPYILDSEDFLQFGIKSDPDAELYLIHRNLVAVNSESGIYAVMLEPSDTILAKFGTYYYDIGLQKGAHYYSIVDCSPFDICYNVTEWVDPLIFGEG